MPNRKPAGPKVPTGPCIFQTSGHHLVVMWAEPERGVFEYARFDCDAWYDAETVCRTLRERVASGTDPASVALREHYCRRNLERFLGVHFFGSPDSGP